MASGFQQRWKGKVAAGQLWLGPQGSAGQVKASYQDLNSVLGASSGQNLNGSTLGGGAGSTVKNSGVTQILTTAIGVFLLADPIPGGYKVISASAGTTAWLVSMESTGVTVQGCSTVLGGSSLTNTIKSTQSLVATQVELLGMSTTQYMFLGVSPTTLSHLLFSTAT